MIDKLVVLDIDDTLTKSESQHQSAFVETMLSFGITDINQQWEDYEHMTDSFILKQNYERNFSDAFSMSFVEEFEERMTQAMFRLTPVTEIKGASKALHHIVGQADWGICFATGSFLKPALLKLEQAEIPANPKLVVGSNAHVTREEIVQESIRSAMECYQASELRHIISVGDGLWDWKTAKNLDIHFIGIGENKHFKAANIPVHIHDWTEFDLASSLQKLTM